MKLLQELERKSKIIKRLHDAYLALRYGFPGPERPEANCIVHCPFTRLTSSNAYHWGAYYDQIHFDPQNRYVISNEVSFEGRSPRPEDSINIGVIDTWNNNKWLPLGSTHAWNWQQGCMLQWIPGEESKVVWNDRDAESFVSYVYDFGTDTKYKLPNPVYGIAPNGKFTIFPDFARLNDTRPGYGYCGLPDKNQSVLAPNNAGLWKMDLQTGETKLLFSFEDIAKIAPLKPYSHNAKHWFNHVIISPDSKRFVFLHRWRGEEEGESWKTRMITANTSDGSDIRIINPNNMVSHNVWYDNNSIIAYARYDAGDTVYLIDAYSGESKQIENDYMRSDTHISVIPHTNGEWILNDTYPQLFRFQELYLIHIPSQRKISLGKFYSPDQYQGECRCDLHPRCSRDGKKVLFDSTHEGLGRQIYMADISNIINTK